MWSKPITSRPDCCAPTAALQFKQATAFGSIVESQAGSTTVIPSDVLGQCNFNNVDWGKRWSGGWWWDASNNLQTGCLNPASGLNMFAPFNYVNTWLPMAYSNSSTIGYDHENAGKPIFGVVGAGKLQYKLTLQILGPGRFTFRWRETTVYYVSTRIDLGGGVFRWDTSATFAFGAVIEETVDAGTNKAGDVIATTVHEIAPPSVQMNDAGHTYNSTAYPEGVPDARWFALGMRNASCALAKRGFRSYIAQNPPKIFKTETASGGLAGTGGPDDPAKNYSGAQQAVPGGYDPAVWASSTFFPDVFGISSFFGETPYWEQPDAPAKYTVVDASEPAGLLQRLRLRRRHPLRRHRQFRHERIARCTWTR